MGIQTLDLPLASLMCYQLSYPGWVGGGGGVIDLFLSKSIFVHLNLNSLMFLILIVQHWNNFKNMLFWNLESQFNPPYPLWMPTDWKKQVWMEKYFNIILIDLKVEKIKSILLS